MNTTRRMLTQQLEAQVELSDMLAENNLETPTRFIKRVNNEQIWIYRQPLSVEAEIKLYERAIKIYSR